MSAEIECAVLVIPSQAAWVDPWLAKRGLNLRRQKFSRLPLSSDPWSEVLPVSALDSVRHDLYRYQLCILPVDQVSLAWVRTAFASLSQALPIPLLCLCQGLRAEAIGDLLYLGVVDFMDVDCGVEEVRARSAHIVKASHLRLRRLQAEGISMDSEQTDGRKIDASRADIVHQSPCSRPDSMPAFQSETHFQEHRVPYLLNDVPSAERGDESFHAAKKRVVDRFECEYLRSALMRAAGNVASAARASTKHRRAFWALMRKHGIHADSYRHGRRMRR